MPDVYQAYKPLRNRLRQHNLTKSLEDLWGLSRHIVDGGPPPVRTPLNLRKYLWPWDLDLIVREVVLNASEEGTKRFNTFEEIRDVTNMIRSVENEVAKFHPNIDGVMNVLHRSAHRQFPWQRKKMMMELSRYMSIFGSEEVDNILQKGIGIGIREFAVIGAAASGHLARSHHIGSTQDYSGFGIGADRAARLFEKISSPVEELRQLISDRQSYDEHWGYSWSPLVSRPLIALNPDAPHMHHCPIPQLLLNRIGQGLYYDIFDEIGFNSAFGNAFQEYVGELSRRAMSASKFVVTAEGSYKVRGNIHHGTDWILSDKSANIFIECKTKRLRMDAKGALDSPSLTTELDIMAGAIVQLYKNIRDAKEGLSHWENNRLPIWPLVVTLEDWYLFGKPIQEKLKESVQKKLSESKLSCEATIDAMPYTVMSSAEYEIVAGVIDSVGVQAFFSKVTDAEYWGWMIPDIVRSAFPDVPRRDIRGLFRDVWESILPEASLPDADGVAVP